MSITELQKQTNTNIQEKANLIWEVATHLVGPFKPHEYGKVILPMTVLKRFDDALKSKHDAVRALLLYHLLHEVRSDGQEVNLVGNSFRGLYRSNVRIDENRVDAFLLQCLERLRTGVVKFSCLTDFQCAGTEQQDFLYIVFFHLHICLLKM